MLTILHLVADCHGSDLRSATAMFIRFDSDGNSKVKERAEIVWLFSMGHDDWFD
jgi:hypothetical protein